MKLGLEKGVGKEKAGGQKKEGVRGRETLSESNGIRIPVDKSKHVQVSRYVDDCYACAWKEEVVHKVKKSLIRFKAPLQAGTMGGGHDHGHGHGHGHGDGIESWKKPIYMDEIWVLTSVSNRVRAWRSV